MALALIVNRPSAIACLISATRAVSKAYPSSALRNWVASALSCTSSLLVAADGGPLTWPLQISLLQTKEFALLGTRIPAERALALGLANHVVADPLTEALAAAKKISELPQKAVESTKRILNMQLERQVQITLDYATTAEELTFGTPELKANIAKLLESK